MNIYTIITLLVLVFYGGSLLIANSIIKNLFFNWDVPRHWSGRINVKKLKELRDTTTNELIKSQATKAIVLLKLGKYVVYIGLAVFVLSMILKVR